MLDGPGLSAEQIEEFHREGFVVLDSFFQTEFTEMQHALGELYPTAAAYFEAPERFSDLRGGQFDSVRTVPTGYAVLDRVPFAPVFERITRQVAGAAEVRLLRAGYQAKYAGAADFDQVLHRDYGNHTLVVPSPSAGIVGFFAYFTEVTLDDGPTMVVRRADSAHLRPAITHLSRAEHPDVYEAERPLTCPAGTLLVYDNATFHRGTRLQGDTGFRLTLSFAMAADAPWHGFIAWPNRAEEPSVQRLLCELTPAQRTLIGFPPQHSPYWTPDTVSEVGARYPAMDMAPYVNAASGQ